ncbi:hypothetical protein BD410DRAFT_809274 [Rickenella mellea]|uniref:Uncharacterized protein n=1 Tax=Rickenella mellea TaxID=50990 RepID=A0A4Y7PJJ3_9AGAM|nr:hypothetical protein BD410DRAFT_809274 [Rickenella mellea]
MYHGAQRIRVPSTQYSRTTFAPCIVTGYTPAVCEGIMSVLFGSGRRHFSDGDAEDVDEGQEDEVREAVMRKERDLREVTDCVSPAWARSLSSRSTERSIFTTFSSHHPQASTCVIFGFIEMIVNITLTEGNTSPTKGATGPAVHGHLTVLLNPFIHLILIFRRYGTTGLAVLGPCRLTFATTWGVYMFASNGHEQRRDI